MFHNNIIKVVYVNIVFKYVFKRLFNFDTLYKVKEMGYV